MGGSERLTSENCTERKVIRKKWARKEKNKRERGGD